MPGCWDATEDTQTWPGSSEAVRDQEPAPLLAKAAGGRVGATSSQASSDSSALQDRALLPGEAAPLREKLSEAPGKAQAVPPSQLPLRPTTLPADAVLRTGTGGSFASRRRLWLGCGSIYHARPLTLTPWLNAEPKATPRGGAQEARRVWGECCELSPSSRVWGCGGSLTERTLMRIGVSNRHAILSLPTRLQPEPARGPALSITNYWANDRHLCRKSGR